jgi:ElaB/YqjD/DUF883 family membrane-anchored ribosome-binding protein
MTMDADALRDSAREKLIADMKIVVDDAEALLKASTDQAGRATPQRRKGERRGDVFEHCEAWRIDAVVVSQQYAIGQGLEC